MENITAKFNRYTAPTVVEDLKVRNIFEPKVKLLKAITKWSIMCGLSFTSLKTNKTCYTAVCASVVDGDNASRDVCPWRLHASVPKNSSGYFRIKNLQVIECLDHSQSGQHWALTDDHVIEYVSQSCRDC